MDEESVTQGRGSRSYGALATQGEADQITHRCRYSQVPSLYQRRKMQIWKRNKLRMNLVTLDWNEDVGMNSIF